MPASIPDILQNIEDQLPAFWRLVTATTFVMGFFFALRAFMEFKVYGELRVMMSQSTNVMKPLSTLFLAVMFLFWPDVIHNAVTSLFGSPDIAPGTGSKIFVILGHLVQLIGFISFIRGWLLLGRAAHQGGQQPGMVSKGIAHIIGGVLAVNIFQTWKLVEALFT